MIFLSHRQSSVTAKFGRRSPKPYYHGKQRIEFVRMHGPAGRGLAEMAIAKYKEANFYVETPTEEPGFSITDFQMEDEEMEVRIYFQLNLFSFVMKV